MSNFWHTPEALPEAKEEANSDQPETGEVERALPGRPEKVYKCSYDYAKRSWSKQPIFVEIDPKPFAEGGMRTAHHMKIIGQSTHFVAKKIKDQTAKRQDYEADITMQALCQELAKEYNNRNPPKPVKFIETFLIERFEKPKKPLMACEPKLTGSYVKFNNNAGFVSVDDRNTPQAFSHFTHVVTNGRYLICDVQGIGDDKTPDVYTDPQVHAPLEPMAYGQGNLGQDGVNRFFSTHRCNDICVGLGLSKHQEDFIGTTMNPKFSSPKVSTEYKKGERVLVKRSNGSWVPSIINEVNANSYVVLYDDNSGTKEISFDFAPQYIKIR